MFRIHDLLQDYITSKAREHNIVTVYSGGEKQWPEKIRRLSIQSCVVNLSLGTSNFEHLRSLMLSNGGMEIGKIKEILSKCRLLRVLDLRRAPIETIPDEVFELYLLKYLCLMHTRVKLIPKSIKYLQNLEILNLANTDVTELPVEILELRRLRHLLVCRYGDTNYQSTSKLAFDYVQSLRAPYGIGRCLQSLQTLNCIDADEEEGNIKIVKEVGMLTQLRVLSIAKLRSEDGNDLCSSIAKLTNLRTLKINSIEEGEKLELDHHSLSSSAAGLLPFLTTLYLNGRLEKVPQWVPSLHALSSLWLRCCKLREDPLQCLENSPNLTHLRIHGALVEGLSFRARGFQKLKKLTRMKWVKVEHGSLAFLRSWMMVGCILMRELPQGMEHLTNVQDLHFRDMPNEYMEKVIEEKKRVAHTSRISFGTITVHKWLLEFRYIVTDHVRVRL